MNSHFSAIADLWSYILERPLSWPKQAVRRGSVGELHPNEFRFGASSSIV